ncbi:MAG: hypothetical protein AAGE80_05640 [Pseudomonadota bacterium]
MKLEEIKDQKNHFDHLSHLASVRENYLRRTQEAKNHGLMFHVKEFGGNSSTEVTDPALQKRLQEAFITDLYIKLRNVERRLRQKGVILEE